jgi:hyperosmotically inducible periplasmic protein
MKAQAPKLSLALSLTLSLTLLACDNRNSAETAGRKLDEVVAKASEKIDLAAKKLDEQGGKVAEVLDDAALTAKVKAAILAAPGLKVLQIDVETTKGVSTLSGSVDSELSSQRAERLAAAVSGVKRVDNRLSVKPVN